MATSLSEIYDIFMMNVTDYRLVDLYNTSQADFETYLQSWLNFSISEFSICDQDLTYDEATNEFSVVLTMENKNILALLMVKYWLQKLVNDVTQMNLHVTDRDFRIASEAQNLREKSAYLNMVKEQCSQMLVDYGFSKTEWTNWFNQDFA